MQQPVVRIRMGESCMLPVCGCVVCFIMKINGGTFIPGQNFILQFPSLEERKESGGEPSRCLEAWNETLHLVRTRQRTDNSNFSLSFRRKYEEIETVL